MSKNDSDTFRDVWQRAPSFMRWWYRVAVVYHTIMMLWLLIAVGIIVHDLMTSSPNVRPAHHGTEFAGTLAAGMS